MKLTSAVRFAVAVNTLCSTAASILPLSAPPAYVPFDRTRDFTSSFALDAWATPVTFEYSTPEPHDKNWIGIWPASGGGPEEGHRVADHASAWEYAEDSAGRRYINVDNLGAGDYRAYFLAKDIYVSLAAPFNFYYPGYKATLYFPSNETSLRNAREGEAYLENVGGLVIGEGHSIHINFQKAGGDDWIQVWPDGSIRGTPPAGSGGRIAVAQVEGKAADTAPASIQINIMVQRSSERLVDSINVMTWSMWDSGTHFSRYHEKQMRFILGSNVDLIAFQDIAEVPIDHLERIANALGWWRWRGDLRVAIISRYPIVAEFSQIVTDYFNPGGGVRVSLNGLNQDDKVAIEFWSVALFPLPYGPNEFCKRDRPLTQQQVLANEVHSERMVQLKATMDRIIPQIDNSSGSTTPTILAGDFNAPSHLDWVDSLKEKNCGVGGGFPWPSSIIVTAAGMDDSLRVANPDPAKYLGTTWNIRKLSDPQDRIDFVYGSKDLEVLASVNTVGGGDPKARDPEWTSDHAAIVSLSAFREPEPSVNQGAVSTQHLRYLFWMMFRIIF
ncbi:uncharacterized protein AB675_2934 [Cyphellophora attinorum]|uniref:Endonuclease/exonuclease/phosphatase domain-containing protein n=1 Tax=Cyphellophora attinorum TaxID=1664694 RepID=A0A0N1NY64_9EURO|nr:uncharacterized protein AB675_2934 [Phialophora attinorum]KPI36480.1 hypothetical protein AB675_2934 [Phialophora attinorum]